MLKATLFYISVFIFSLLLLATNARSQTSDLKLSVAGRQAYKTLLVAYQFEDKYIGFGDSSSTFVEAYNVLLKESSADAAFKSLLEKATLPGQLYALCGLWITDNAFFRTAVENYRRSDKSVAMLSGCLGGTTLVAGLIETENPIIIDINRPKESLNEYFKADSREYAEWNKRKKKKKSDIPPKGHNVDILHGGYSIFFRN